MEPELEAVGLGLLGHKDSTLADHRRAASTRPVSSELQLSCLATHTEASRGLACAGARRQRVGHTS